MPEQPMQKIKPQVEVKAARAKGPYAELQVTSNFSFLRGGSHPEEMVARGAELGCAAVAVTDINTLAGIVRGHAAAKELGVDFIVGCHLQVKGALGVLAKGAEAPPLSLLVYPTDRASYGRLCRMLTFGKRRAEKGKCDLTLQDVVDHQEGLLAVVLPPPLLTEDFAGMLGTLRDIFNGDRLSLSAACLYDGRNEERLGELSALGGRFGVPLVATNDVHYHVAERKPLQDVLTCIRLGCTVSQAGFALFANSERHMKGPEEMARLFQDHPAAVRQTLEIAERAKGFSLNQLKYQYPSEVCPPGKNMMEHLIDRTWEGAKGRYPEAEGGIPETIKKRLAHEFALIRDLDYPAYFLTVDDIVAFARSQGILCQGRGAAANSAVCYCLGITSVDPARIDLLVERFISKERNEPPDIDIDFEHERREEVIQYIYQKYGRERAALTAEVISYRRRSAVREVGKALGLSLDCVDKLAKSGDWWDEGVIDEPRLRELGLDPRDITIRQVVTLAGELIGFPRHLSQHVGGFVMTQGPLCEMVPVENAAMPDRTVIEWDKDDIDEMGMLKVDVLGLGMLTCIRKALAFVNEEELRNKGTKELREKGDKSINSSVPQFLNSFYQETVYGAQAAQEPRQDISRSDRLAKGDGTGATALPGNRENASGGAVWSDQSDAAGSGVDSLQHCGGQRAPESAGLPEIFENCTGIAGRIANADRAGSGIGNDGNHVTAVDIAGGSGSGPAVFDHGVGKKEGRRRQEHGEELRNKGTKGKREKEPASLSALVPQCLSSFSSRPLQFHTIPAEDPAVYDMLCLADSIGVFQVESRAQMTMLPRLKPRNYYDLVIEVAIVRPGPIQGGMVHPYLRRRNGLEKVDYPSEGVRSVLERTLGVPLFQEQAMRLVMVAAGFSAGEADQLRRAMAAWKRKGHLIEKFTGKILSGMAANGYTREFAEKVVRQIRGFADYGFPESHAASFAHLVYVSAWLKKHHPAAFAAALINSQPMGFYQPAQIVRDAAEHGVEVRAVDVNASGWDCTLEPAKKEGGRPALRLGMRLVAGAREKEIEKITAAVKVHGGFESVTGLWRASGVSVASLRKLAMADGFNSMGLDRQQALWAVGRLRDEALPMFEACDRDELPADLPEVPEVMRVIHDYSAIGLSLKAHPISFARQRLTECGVTRAGELSDEKKWPHGKHICVAGLALVRQRPGTASGIMFMTIEDETGVANLVIRPPVYEKYRRAIRLSTAVVAWGKVEREGQVVHVLVERAANLGEVTSGTQTGLKVHSRDFH